MLLVGKRLVTVFYSTERQKWKPGVGVTRAFRILLFLNFNFCYLPYYSSFRDEVVVLDARSVLSLADIKSPSEELYKREAAGRIVIGETDVESSDILTA